MKNSIRKKKSMKVLLIIFIVLAVCIPVELYMLGSLWSIGPMKGLHAKKVAAMPGNAQEYAFSAIEPIQDSPLAGKNLCILGSSVVHGSASLESAAGKYLAARFDMTLTKEAVSGTTLCTIKGNNYVERMIANLDPNSKFDLFVCQLSTNDATKKLPLGEVAASSNMEDFDTSTITGAMEYIIVYARQTWDCPVVFFTGSYYESAEYSAMVGQLLQLQKKIWYRCSGLVHQ